MFAIIATIVFKCSNAQCHDLYPARACAAGVK